MPLSTTYPCVNALEGLQCGLHNQVESMRQALSKRTVELLRHRRVERHVVAHDARDARQREAVPSLRRQRCAWPGVLGIQQAQEDVILQLVADHHDRDRVVVLERCGVSHDRADKPQRRDEDLDACLDLGLGLHAPCPHDQH